MYRKADNVLTKVPPECHTNQAGLFTIVSMYQIHASPGKSRRSQTEEDMVAGVELLAQAIDSVIMRVQVSSASDPDPAC
jgi:hypothetical protein